jgi:hypothetical protein
VLSQEQHGQERVIAFASKTLSSARKRYCTTYRKVFAVVPFVKCFRVYLLGRQLLFRMDHASLTWLLNFKDLETGRQHGNADGLSRRPEARKCKRADCPVCTFATGEGNDPSVNLNEKSEAINKMVGVLHPRGDGGETMLQEKGVKVIPLDVTLETRGESYTSLECVN